METEQQKAALKSALIDEIKRHNGFRDERLYIFGYSYITQVLCETLYAHQVQVEAFLDNARDKIGTMHGDIPILAPASLPSAQNVYVLIHSAHAKEMIAQLKEIVPDIGTRIINLEYPKKDSDGFWKETQYETSLRMLREGEEIYQRLKEDDCLLVVNPVVSIGDYCLMEMTLHQYLKQNSIKKHKVIACGGGAAKTVRLFAGESVDTLTWEEMRSFVKFVMFMGEDKTNTLMVFPFYHVARRLYHLYNATKFTSTEMYPMLVYQLNEPYEPRYPDIYSSLTKEEKETLALRERKSVIISPYTNTVGALPNAFWSQMINAFSEKGYKVYTNVTHAEKELPGTYRLEMSLAKMGTCMNLAGTFIALRSGISDITGRADCRQIVIYSKSYKTLGNTFRGFEHNDLRVMDVAPNVVQMIFDEEDMSNTVTAVKRALGI